MGEQPRVPAGDPKGGQWTSTSQGVGAASPSHSRGDWVKKQRFDAITEGAVLTAEPGDQIRVDIVSDNYDDQRKEEIEFRARLDPTRSWRVSTTHDRKTWVATDLGEKSEHDRLLGGPGLSQIAEVRNKAQYSWKSEVDEKQFKVPEIEGLGDGSVYGVRGQVERLLRQRETLTTPAVVRAQAERVIDNSIKDAFKDLPKDWEPSYIPYTVGREGPPEFRQAQRTAYIEKERVRITAATKELRERFGTPERLREHIEQQVVKDLEATSPGMVMNNKTLGLLLDGEPLKNYREGVKSGVSNANAKDTREGYLITRTFDVDAQQFGIPITAPGSVRPVHGLVVTKDPTPEQLRRDFSGAKVYGGRSPVLVTYHDHVKNGSTVTSGDSLDAKRIAVPYDKPTIHSIAPGSIGRGGDDRLGDAEFILTRHVNKSVFQRDSSWYDEVQFHRRPTAKDIKHVAFTKEPTAAVKKKLTAIGATWSVVPLESMD